MKQGDYTHVAISKLTKRKIAILAPVRNVRILDLVCEWADDDWEDAKIAGLVNDQMLTQEPEREQTAKS